MHSWISGLSDVEKSVNVLEVWNPTIAKLMVIITMAVASLMVALDATILVTVLPVCPCSQ